MPRIILSIAVAILTFVIGVGSSSLSRRLRSQRQSSIASSVNPRRTYQRTMHFDARKGSLWIFRSSDGREFQRWTITCGSPEGARKKMNELLKTSVGIFSSERVKGPLGEPLGEETIAVFPTNDRENGVASLFYVSKSEYLVQITGSSLQNVLDFRDDSRRNY